MAQCQRHSRVVFGAAAKKRQRSELLNQPLRRGSSDQSEGQVGLENECRVCRQTFPSRNALFRHLRLPCDCSVPSQALDRGNFRTDGPIRAFPSLTDKRDGSEVPFRIAVRFGYCPMVDSTASLSSSTVENSDALPESSAADAAADWILRSLRGERGGRSFVDAKDTLSNSDRLIACTNLTIGSVTRSSDARLRAACLKQEEDCAAAGDVLVVTGTASISSESPAFQPESNALPVRSSFSLDQELSNRLFASRWPSDVDSRWARVDAVKMLDRPLHAERSCTQYVYHYLLPISWLLDPAHELMEWVEQEHSKAGSIRSSDVITPRPRAMVQLKRALRRMESPRFCPSSACTDDESGDETAAAVHTRGRRRMQGRSRSAAGRFGGLAFKTRQAFHNYCDQQLMGAIAPNHDVVWRCVDRARIVDVHVSKSNTTSPDTRISASLVVEFRGDSFLPHQIRTMVGTAVAMANGWLPMERTVPRTTSPDQVIAPLPCAPSGRLYLVTPRFHFEEMTASGKSFFESNTGGTVISSETHGIPADEVKEDKANMEWVQQSLISRKDSLNQQQLEKSWLQNVEVLICPAIRVAFERADAELTTRDDFSTSTATDMRHQSRISPPPEPYSQVLSLLRSVVAEDKWPETSVARSAVIRTSSATENAGSFTVVNPSMVDRSAYPLGNELFPDLVRAVFALEETLSVGQRERVEARRTDDGGLKLSTSQTSRFRASSSHCAINCKAQFLPHVDSGFGAGQTVSLIAGLGDYSGGQLVVEGSLHDIRYRPLEFDGWKLRHWTRPFQGERFSLVFYTPAAGPASVSSRPGSTRRN